MERLEGQDVDYSDFGVSDPVRKILKEEYETARLNQVNAENIYNIAKTNYDIAEYNAIRNQENLNENEPVVVEFSRALDVVINADTKMARAFDALKNYKGYKKKYLKYKHKYLSLKRMHGD